MRRRTRLIGWLLAPALVSVVTAQPAPRRQAFTGIRLLDVTAGRVVEDAVLVVQDGRIEAAGPRSQVTVPPGTPATALDGRYVVPGFHSAHVHVSDVQGLGPKAYTEANVRRQLGVFARYGVTSVWSLGGEQAPAFTLRDSEDVASLNRARLHLAGEIVVGTTPDEARQVVARVAATKPDIIKIRIDDNLGTAAKMTPEVFRAVIDEAHQRGLRVAAHIFYLDDAKAVVRAGADVIAHSVRDRDMDDEFIALMKARDLPYCPTLTRDLSTFVYESRPSFFDDPFFLREADRDVVAQLLEPARQEAMRTSKSAQAYKVALSVAERNLARASAAGLRVVLGTDAGPFPERFQGYFEHLEMEMMVKAGLTPLQVLRAATIDAARGMRVADIGALTEGAWADFVVLDDDPLRDIRHTRAIHSVWIAGNQVARP